MKQAVILGISGDLGKAIARMLLKKGYRILGTSHTHQAEEFAGNGNVEVVSLDLSDANQVEKFCSQIGKLEGIDFMVNTIGSYTMGRFEQIPFETFQKDFNLNVLLYIQVLQKAFPKFRKDANLIFILTEMVVGDPSYFLTPYVSSKYALLGLMRALAGELKQRGIRVNGVSPGMMDTRFIASVPRIVKEQYLRNSPLGKFVDPKEVANVIENIVDDPSMNGENIPLLGKKMPQGK